MDIDEALNSLGETLKEPAVDTEAGWERLGATVGRLEQIEEHMHTPLVLWGWNPGPGRTPVSMSQQQFLQSVHTWVSSGAVCP